MSGIHEWLRPKPSAPTLIYSVRMTVDGSTKPSGVLVLDRAGERLDAQFVPDSGLLIWDIGSWPHPYGVTWAVTAEGCLDQSGRDDLSTFTADSHNPNLMIRTLPTITLKPAVPELPPLTIDGAFFRAAGQPHTIIQATDFKLLKLILDGVDIRPVIEQRRDLGFNDLRVLSLCKNMFELWPALYPAYWAAAHQLCELAAGVGLRVTMVVHADSRLVMPDQGQQVAHWRAWGDVARAHSNVRLSLVNEVEQSPNIIDISIFPRLDGVMCSRGSHGGGDIIPPRPWWDFEELHFNGQSESQRKIAHNSMEVSDGVDGVQGSHVPVEASESNRFTDQWNRPDYAFAIGQSSALLIAGWCFHSQAGKTSTLWSGQELDCAREGARGSRSVDLQFQRGRYEHRAELETPQIIRVYRRVLPDGRYFQTAIPA